MAVLSWRVLIVLGFLLSARFGFGAGSLLDERVKLEALAVSLQAAIDSGRDPALVVFPGGAVRFIRADVLPGYLKLIRERVRKITAKIEAVSR